MARAYRLRRLLRLRSDLVKTYARFETIAEAEKRSGGGVLLAVVMNEMSPPESVRTWLAWPASRFRASGLRTVYSAAVAVVSSAVRRD
jgi:hypothetical protein